jgi:inositol-pentakisphosphate 2-kinase
MYGATQGILMHDATLLPSPHEDKTDLHAVQPPSAPAAAPPTLAIELKPKFGSTVDCPTSQPEDARIKRNASRYRLHQLLKLQQGAIAHPNAYDPLDLFSGDGSRMEAALMALFEHPQNNLRVFIDGEAVAMPSEVDGPGRDGTCELGDRSCSVPSALAAIAARALLLPQTTREDAWSPVKVLVESIRMILTAEGVLDHLLEMQKMCEHDIEGVHALYCHVLGGGYHSHAQDQGTASGEASGIGLVQEGERRAALQRLMEAPRSEAIRILRAYSIASTARDCSLMIALQRWCGVEKAGACASSIPSAAHARHQNRLQGEDPSYCGVLQHPESDIVLRYRVTVVDLDRKPLRKIPKHLVLDREIMATARPRQCGCVCMT